MNARALRAAGAAVLLLASLPPLARGADPDVERRVRAHVEAIRAVKPVKDPEEMKRFNTRMDEAWAYFNAHRDVSVPILLRTVAAELKARPRNDLVLLDAGYFLYLHGGTAERDIARTALFAVDPAAEIVRWNGRELFGFTHAVAVEGDPRLLAWLDRAFLRGTVTAFIPQHALQLDETLVCVFLYGVHGRDSEVHLAALLSDPSVARRALEVLIWLGSPESDKAVEAFMRAHGDYASFTRAAAFLMRLGGPAGRSAMLAVNRERLEPAARSYYDKIRPAVEAVTYEAIRKPLREIPGEARLDDAEVRRRLTAMIANDGRDDRTSPLAVLDSGLPRAFLVEELRKVRQAALHRISDEALTDVEVTNALINALHYRP